jgi:hypothetical protein
MTHQHGARAFSSQIRHALKPRQLTRVTHRQFHVSNRKSKPTELSVLDKSLIDIPPLTLPARPLPSHLMTIAPGSLNHSCLKTFLAHAARTNLNTTSTHFVGTRYEYLVATTLARLGFSLVRVGRGGDAGVDLLGEWTLPTAPHSSAPVPPAPLRVLLQCKRHNRRLVPEFVRELEGAFAGAPAGWHGENTIGLLVSPKDASKGVRAALQRSRMPIGFIALEEISLNGGITDGHGLTGRITQLLWNWRAQEVGLEGFGATWNHLPGANFDEDEAAKELTLTWNGWAVSAQSADLTTRQLSTVKDHTTTIVANKTCQPSNETMKVEAQEQGPLSTSIDPPKKQRGRPRKIKT